MQALLSAFVHAVYHSTFLTVRSDLFFSLFLQSVFLQISNKVGSTKDPPVVVEASVYSDIGSLQPQRLKQLAQIIMGSVPKSNLGLDNSVFGKVNQVSLSSFLNRTVHAASPAPTPAPAPNEPLWPSPSPSPSVSSSPSPAPAPLSNCRRLRSHARHHCGPAHGEEPSSSPSPIADPPSPVTSSGPPSSSSGVAASPSSHAPTYPPKLSPRVNLSPGPSPQMSSSISSSSSCKFLLIMWSLYLCYLNNSFSVIILTCYYLVGRIYHLLVMDKEPMEIGDFRLFL